MFNYTIELKENGEWREEPRWGRPFFDETTLDESLDSGSMKLWLFGRKQRIEPFTPIRIKIYEVEKNTPNVMKLTQEERAPYLKEVIYRISGDSSVEQKRFEYNMPGVPEYFMHTVQTLEPTKLLERDICDTLTFTNKLGRNYLDGATDVSAVLTKNGYLNGNFELETPYKTPMALNSNEIIKSAECLFRVGDMTSTTVRVKGGSILVITPNGEKIIAGTCHESSRKENEMWHHYAVFTPTKSIKFEKIGTYKIVYRLISSATTNTNTEWTTTIEVIDGVISPSYYTITQVLERILSAGVTRTKDTPQKYTLNPAIAERFKNVQSPEFYLPQGTLWEALLAVGGYIHGIPRLLWNEETDKPDIITFDMLGETVGKDVTARVAAYTETIRADQYCDKIDSVVQNVLNTRDRKQGTIIDPCGGGFKSVRCDTSTVEISDDNAVITTTLGIDTISKVTVKNIITKETGDITPYLFEAAEYDGVLSEYTASYPYSKAWALRYEQGGNQITGLAFKLESVSSISAAFKEPAIENILNAVDVTVPSHYKDLAFQIEYVPYINMRVVQKKTYGTGKSGGTMFYNQGANRVENEVYGENMKGVVARLGNGEQMRTYHFKTYVEIPKCGQTVDGLYISKVSAEYELQFIKCTLTLTPNFNRLAQYLGTFTEFRLYDVSERQCENRYINYGKDIIFGAREADGGILPDAGKSAFLSTLSPNAVTENEQITGVYAWGDDNDDHEYKTVMLPCSSFAFGNSLAFTFEYVDNYSAGDKSSDSSEGAKRIKQAVPYGNKYGEFKYLNIRCFSAADGINPHDLPEIADRDSLSQDSVKMSYTGNKALQVEKDSREKLNVTLQLHIRANLESVVIGSRLAQNNGLVTNAVDNERRPIMYLLKSRLHPFNDIIDIADAKSVKYTLNIEEATTSNYITFSASTKGYKSWAIIDPIDHRLYVGKNLDDIVDGEEPNRLYISFAGGEQ